MNREQVIATLREHEPELKAAEYPCWTLSMSKTRFADLLGEPVDLLVEGTLKPHVRENVTREAVRGF